MLEIVQTGQFGKTHLLFDMHRLRKRVFKDKMGWDVPILSDDLEIDQFDLPETIYVLALDDDGRVIGNWRLLPTTGPTMIRDIWPQFLKTVEMPSDPLVWESSRFAVSSFKGETEEGLNQVSRATQELFCGVAELCFLCGIRELYAMYDMRIARILDRLKCKARKVSERIKIGDIYTEVGVFVTDEKMLMDLRSATSIRGSLIGISTLPPILRDYYEQNKSASTFRKQLVMHG